MRRTEREGSRRRFLGQLGATVGALAVAGPGIRRAMAVTSEAAATAAAPSPPGGAAPGYAAADVVPTDWFPRQDPRLVQEVVGVAHRDLEAVRELVGKRPELAKAQWDWGFGDWESPLDAASHVGHREIALFLLQHGARPTIFSAAMLGQLEVVRAFVAAAPGIQATLGPHGIPLLAHGQVGGEPAKVVVAYLETLGGADGGLRPAPLAEAEAQRYLGTYRYGAGAADLLEVTLGRGRFGLAIAPNGGSPRGLTAVGDHAFHPAGARSVRVRFEMAGERARAVAIYDPDLLVRGTRAG